MISLSTLHFIPLQIIGLILRYRLFLFEEKKKQVSRPFFIVWPVIRLGDRSTKTTKIT